MEQIQQANKLANEFISNHPFQKEIVEGLLQLMKDAIEAGESSDNELELFKESLQELEEDDEL